MSRVTNPDTVRDQKDPTQIAKALKNDNPLVLQTGLIIFGAVVVLLAWGFTLHQFSSNQVSLLDRLEREQQNLCGVLAENLFQIIEQKQAIEMLANNWLDHQRQKSLDDITSFLYGERSFNRVVLYDKFGNTFYQSSPHHFQDKQTKINIPHYIEQMASGKNLIFISSETDLLNVPWQIPLLFPLKRQGEIKGALLLELDMGYLLNLLQDINLGRTGRITVSTDQGRHLARFESGGLVVDSSQPQRTVIPSLKDSSGSGIYRYSGSKERHLAYRRIQEYPMIIVVSQEVDDFFSEFRTHKKRLLWTLSILTSLCLAGLYFLLRLINRKHHYLSALAVSHEQNKELILKLEQEHKASTKAASVDALTGLYNRRLFVYLAQKQLLSAKRNRLVYAVLFIDLDRFKKINDTLGHRVGDLLLKTVAQRLETCTRKSDIVARFGGDEFVVMLSEMTTEDNILPIVKKIITTISEPCENLDGHRIITSPSIGVSVYPRDGVDIESLLLNADAAMYKSKKSGRGRYSFFDTSLNTVSAQKFELEQRMPAAISDEEFVLHYQPKIRLEDFRVVGLEALVRWNHPTHQLIFPSDFIEIAEETGLIIQLGQQLLNQACRQMVDWKNAGLDLVPVAVNVSPLELQDSGYADTFAKILDHYQLPPELIEIEITENAFIRDKDTVIGNLNTLSDNGVSISLDDFGKGFSSLSNVRNLPVNTLKIDRSFIQDIRNRFNDNPIVSSTIILAQKLSMKVVAEGVETHDQLLNLKVAGCDMVQGYYFSRPVPEDGIREYITSPLRSISI